MDIYTYSEGNFSIRLITISIRDFHRGSAQPRSAIYLNSIAVGLERFGKNIIVGCMDSSLHCYTTKVCERRISLFSNRSIFSIQGKRYWKHLLPAPITAMCQIDYRPKGFQAIAVALANNEVHLYKDKFLVDVIQVEENIYAMKFGRLGREDATLVLITKSKYFSLMIERNAFLLLDGGLIIKILKRTATFEESDVLHGPPKEQQVKIDVPKRTKLYVDQTLREKEQAQSRKSLEKKMNELICFPRYVSNISTRFNSFEIINWKRISQIHRSWFKSRSKTKK